MEKAQPRKDSHFVITRWSLVIAAASEGDTQAASSLAALCEIYWLPLYRYLRRTGKIPKTPKTSCRDSSPPSSRKMASVSPTKNKAASEPSS